MECALRDANQATKEGVEAKTACRAICEFARRSVVQNIRGMAASIPVIPKLSSSPHSIASDNASERASRRIKVSMGALQ